MAVEEIHSDLFADKQNNVSPPDPQRERGRVVNTIGSVANGASDSSGSKYKLCKVPSNLIPHEGTFFDVENWGFAQVVIGTETDTDALVDQTQATENIVTPFVVGDANHGKQLWEVLGLASDPGGFIEIWAHAEDAATGAGSMDFRFSYHSYS